jgi:hypothetical protein
MATTATLVRDDELTLHAEDERCYSAIRSGTLIDGLTWNELTEDEQRAARAVVFCLYSI